MLNEVAFTISWKFCNIMKSEIIVQWAPSPRSYNYHFAAFSPSPSHPTLHLLIHIYLFIFGCRQRNLQTSFHYFPKYFSMGIWEMACKIAANSFAPERTVPPPHRRNEQCGSLGLIEIIFKNQESAWQQWHQVILNQKSDLRTYLLGMSQHTKFALPSQLTRY